MSEKKIIAVVGATGAQGGGLVKAILNDPKHEFVARAITRKPDSDKARELQRLGAQIVAADADDVASLSKAFAGAYGAFCVTNFWEHFSPEKELAQAANQAKATKRAGVAHTIWSTLEDTRRHLPLSDPRMPVLMGKYNVPHFDAKGEADQAFAELGGPNTCLLTSFYWDNLISFGMGPKPGPDGVLVFNLPMGNAKLPGIAAADIGACALGLLRRGEELVGRTVGIAGEHLTGTQMAASLGRALGREVRYNAVPFDVYRGLGFPGAEDLGNMFHFNHDFSEQFCKARDITFSRSLNPALQTFDAWLAANKGRIPLE
jgi:uncharacterized protein YbjT (DUF2867 family)